jgi:predicted nucleic acid-binding protein
LSGIAYIDASAFVKLFALESESEAIATATEVKWSNLVANEILSVEAFRAAVRIGGDAPAAASRALRRVVLLPLSSEVIYSPAGLPMMKSVFAESENFTQQ